MKCLQATLMTTTGRGLDQFIPSESDWVTMETLDTVRLPPVHERRLLRMAMSLGNGGPE